MNDPVKAISDALNALMGYQKLQTWHVGLAGNANVVALDDGDVVGIGQVYVKERQEFVAACNPVAIAILLNRLRDKEADTPPGPK